MKGTHLIGLFSYSLVAGANSLGLGLPCVFEPLGDWWILVARVHLSRTRALSSSLLLMYVEEEGAQESSLTVAKGCVMSSRSGWGDRAAAIVGTFAPVFKSVLAETCAARLGAALIHGVLALTYARSWVGIAAASAAAYGFYCMFLIVCQVASRAAAAWRAGAFVYIFCLEGVFVFACAFGQIASFVAAAASGSVFSQVASFCGSSIECWCVCVHLLWGRCLRLSVCVPVVGSWPLVGMFWDFGSRSCAVFR